MAQDDLKKIIDELLKKELEVGGIDEIRTDIKEFIPDPSVKAPEVPKTPEEIKVNLPSEIPKVDTTLVGDFDPGDEPTSPFKYLIDPFFLQARKDKSPLAPGTAPWKSWGHTTFVTHSPLTVLPDAIFGPTTRTPDDPTFSWDKYPDQWKKLTEGLPEGFAEKIINVKALGQAEEIHDKAISVLKEQQDMAEAWGMKSAIGMQIGGMFIDPVNWVLPAGALKILQIPKIMGMGTLARTGIAAGVGGAEGYVWGKAYEAGDPIGYDHPDWIAPVFGSTLGGILGGTLGRMQQNQAHQLFKTRIKAGEYINPRTGKPGQVFYGAEIAIQRKFLQKQMAKFHPDYVHHLGDTASTKRYQEMFSFYSQQLENFEKFHELGAFVYKETSKRQVLIGFDKTTGTQHVELVNTKTGEVQKIPIEQVGTPLKPKDITPESVVRSKLWDEIDNLGEEEFNRRFREAGLLLQQEGRTSIESPWKTRGAAQDLHDWEIANKELQERFGVKSDVDLSIYRDAAALAIEYRARGEILPLSVLEHFTSLRYRKEKARDILEFLYREGYATGEKLIPGMKVTWKKLTPGEMEAMTAEEALKFAGEDYPATFEFKELIPGLKEDEYTYHYTISEFGSEVIPWFHTGTRKAALDRARKTAGHGGLEPPLGRVLMLPKPDITDKTKWLYLPEDLGGWEPERMIEHLLQIPEVIALKDEGLVEGLNRIDRRMRHGRIISDADPVPVAKTSSPEYLRQISFVLKSYGFEGGYYINAVEDPGSTSLIWFEPQDDFLKHFQTKIYAGLPIDTEEIMAWLKGMGDKGKKITQRANAAILKIFRSRQQKTLDGLEEVDSNLIRSDEKRMDLSERVDINQDDINIQQTNLREHLATDPPEDVAKILPDYVYTELDAFGFEGIREGDLYKPTELLARIESLSPEELNTQILQKYKDTYVEWDLVYHKLRIWRDTKSQQEIETFRQSFTRTAAEMTKYEIYDSWMHKQSLVAEGINKLYQEKLKTLKKNLEATDDWYIDQAKRYMAIKHPDAYKFMELNNFLGQNYGLNSETIDLFVESLLQETPFGEWQGKREMIEFLIAESERDTVALREDIESEQVYQTSLLEAHNLLNREALTARIADVKQAIKDKKNIGTRGMVTLPPGAGGNKPGKKELGVLKSAQRLVDKLIFPMGEQLPSQGPTRVGGAKPRTIEDIEKRLQTLESMGMPEKEMAKAKQRLQEDLGLGAKIEEGVQDFDSYTTDIKSLEDVDTIFADTAAFEEAIVKAGPEFPYKELRIHEVEEVRDAIKVLSDFLKEEVLPEYIGLEKAWTDFFERSSRGGGEKFQGRKLTKQERQDIKLLREGVEVEDAMVPIDAALPMIHYPKVLNRLIRTAKDVFGRDKAEVMILAKLNLKHLKEGDPTPDWNKFTTDPVFRQEVLDAFRTKGTTKLTKERIRFLSTLHRIKILQDIVTEHVNPMGAFLPNKEAMSLRKLGMSPRLHGRAKSIYSARKLNLLSKIKKEAKLRAKWEQEVGNVDRWFDSEGVNTTNIEEFRAGFTPRDLKNLFDDIINGPKELYQALTKNKALVAFPPTSVRADLNALNTTVRGIKNGIVRLHNIYHPNNVATPLVKWVLTDDLTQRIAEVAQAAGIDPNAVVVRRVTPEMFLGDIDPDTGLPERITKIISNEEWNKGFKNILGGVQEVLDLISPDNATKYRALYKLYTEELERIKWNIDHDYPGRDAQQLATDHNELIDIIKRMKENLDTGKGVLPTRVPFNAETNEAWTLTELNNKINQSKDTLIALNENIKTTRLRIDNFVDLEALTGAGHDTIMKHLHTYTRLLSDRLSLEREIKQYKSDKTIIKDQGRGALVGIVDPAIVTQAITPDFKDSKDFYAYLSETDKKLKAYIDKNQRINILKPEYTRKKAIVKLFKAKREELNIIVNGYHAPSLYPELSRLPARRNVFSILEKFFNVGGVKLALNNKAIEAYRNISYDKMFQRIRDTIAQGLPEPTVGDQYNPQLATLPAPVARNVLLLQTDVLKYRDMDLLDFAKVMTEQLNKIYSTEETLVKELDYLGDLAEYKYLSNDKLKEMLLTNQGIGTPVLKKHIAKTANYLAEEVMRLKELREITSSRGTLGTNAKKEAEFGEKAWFLSNYGTSPEQLLKPIDAFFGEIPSKDVPHQIGITQDFPYSLKTNYDLLALSVWLRESHNMPMDLTKGLDENMFWWKATKDEAFTFFRNKVSLDIESHLRVAFTRLKTQMDAELAPVATFEELARGDVEWGVRPKDDPQKTTYLYAGLPPLPEMVDQIKAAWGIIEDKVRKFSLFFNGKGLLEPELPPLVRKDPDSNFIGSWGKDENNLVLFSHKLPDFINRIRSRRGRSQINELGLIRKFGQWIYGSERLRVDAGADSEGVTMAAAQTIEKSTLLEQGAVKARTRILGEYIDRVMSARDKVIKDTPMPRGVDDIDVIVQDTIYVVYQRLQKQLGGLELLKVLGINDNAVINKVMVNYPALTKKAAKNIVNYAKELNDIKTDFLKRHMGVDIESLNLVTKVEVTDLRRFAGVFEGFNDVNISNEDLLRFLKTDVLNEVRSGIEYDEFSNFAQKLIDDGDVVLKEGTLKGYVIPEILKLLDQHADFSNYENILQIIDTFGLDQVLNNPQKLLLSKEISDAFNVNMLKPYSDEPFFFWDSLRDLNQIAAYGQIEKMLGDSVKGAEIGVLTPRQEELIKNIVGSQGDFRGRMQEVINSYLGHIIYKNISRNANDGTSMFGNFTKDSWGNYLQKNTVDNLALTESPTFPIASIEDTGDLVVSIDNFIRNYFFEGNARLKLELDFDKPHKIELQSNAAETQKLSMDRLNIEHSRLKGKIRSDELITDDIRLKDLPVTTPKDELSVMFGKLITARIESDFIKEFNAVLKSEGLYHKEFTKGEDIFKWVKDHKDILHKQGAITNGREFDLMLGMLERDLLGQKPTDDPREVGAFVQMMQKGATATSIFGFGIPAMLESALPAVRHLPKTIEGFSAFRDIIFNPYSIDNEGLKDFLRGAGVGTEANLFKGSGSSRKSIIFDDKNPMIKNPNTLPPLGNKTWLEGKIEQVEKALTLANPFQYTTPLVEKLSQLSPTERKRYKPWTGKRVLGKDPTKSSKPKDFGSMIDQHVGFLNFFTRKGQDIAAKAFISRVIDKVKDGDFDNFVDPQVAAQIGWSPEDRVTIYRELRTALDTIPEAELRGVSMYDIPSMVNGDSSKGWNGMSGRTRDKFLSGIYNYVGQQIVRPDLGDLPRFMDNKFLSFLMQFRGFGMAEFGKRIGPTTQRMFHGDARGQATAALAAMLLMNGVYAVLTYTLTFPEETKKDLERIVGTRRSRVDWTTIVTDKGLKTRVNRAFLGGILNSFIGLPSIYTDPILDALDLELYTEWFDSSWRGPAQNMAESVAMYRYGKNLGKYPYGVLRGDKDINFEEASKSIARQTGMYRLWQLFRLMDPDSVK